MSNVTGDTHLADGVKRYLSEYPGEIICVRQIWYEGLEGCGVPSPEQMEIMTSAVKSLPGWKDIGDFRYEKFGVQPSFKRGNTPGDPVRSGKIMVQHMFELGSLFKTPDGKVLKVVVSEVYNIRCFEIADGHMTGPMIKFKPQDDFAKSLVKIEN